MNFPLPFPVTVRRLDAPVPDKVTVPPDWKVCSALTVRVFPPRPVAVMFVKVFSPDKVISLWKVAFVIVFPAVPPSSAVPSKLAVVMLVPFNTTAASKSALVMFVCPPPETVEVCKP